MMHIIFCFDGFINMYDANNISMNNAGLQLGGRRYSMELDCSPDAAPGK